MFLSLFRFLTSTILSLALLCLFPVFGAGETVKPEAFSWEISEIFRDLQPVLDPQNEVFQKVSPSHNTFSLDQVEALLALVRKTLTHPNGSRDLDPHLIRTFRPYDTVQIRKHFQTLGYMDAFPPRSSGSIDYVIIPGGLIEHVQEQIRYLRVIYQKRLVKFGSKPHVIFLGTDRPLTLFETAQLKRMYPKSAVLPKTEAQAILWIWNHFALPKAFQELPTRLVEVASALPPRASTPQSQQALLSPLEKVFHLWLTSKPVPGRCLVVSTQPLITYHEAAAQLSFRRLPHIKKWNFEVVGDAASPSSPLSMFVTTLMKTLEVQVRLQASTRSKVKKMR